ncbi:MAG: hypothetical protein OXG15_13060 [Gammaproteobacteria bacterium]|nr:hypothetical protein [Gammaproteobacteria bacterium]
MKLENNAVSSQSDEDVETIFCNAGFHVEFSSNFKFGMTNDPEERLSWYEDNHSDLFEKMVLLYKTHDREDAADLEKALIESYVNDTRMKNEIAGGGGGKGSAPYFVYVIFN